MKSKAHIRTHPVHPMLVAFPIAFLHGAFVFDLLYFFLNQKGYADTAAYLVIAGLCTGVAAAVPGIIDYIHTVPPRSSAKNRGAMHGLLNSLVLFLFLISMLMRGEIRHLYILAIETIAIVCLIIAGWMGGTLVNRNHIGIFNRYANMGKWKEAKFNKDKGEIQVARADTLETDQMMLLRFKSLRIVLGRTAKGYVAFGDHCTHKGASLAGGVMICGTVQCPWHGSQFSVETGGVKAGPAEDKITVYNVSEREGKVFIQL